MGFWQKSHDDVQQFFDELGRRCKGGDFCAAAEMFEYPLVVARVDPPVTISSAAQMAGLLESRWKAYIRYPTTDYSVRVVDDITYSAAVRFVDVVWSFFDSTDERCTKAKYPASYQIRTETDGTLKIAMLVSHDEKQSRAALAAYLARQAMEEAVPDAPAAASTGDAAGIENVSN